MRRSERIIKKLVWWAIAALYHRVEVRQAPDLTSSGPILANSSHFGGFADPLILIYAMDRVPRFIARDVIWRIPVARSVMNWAGAIPVHKPEDGGKSSNDQMFSSTYEALHDGDLVTIFPEGITVDDPSIAQIKTGSARIVLGARADGVSGIRLVSAGIHYENKAALRSDVFVDISGDLDLDQFVADNVGSGEPEDASNRQLVRVLTDEMEARLRNAAPDFEDWATAHALSSAAEIALRDPDGDDVEVGHADRERLARLIDEGPDEDRHEVIDAMAAYQDDLDAMGMSDRMLVSGLNTPSKFISYVVRTLIVGVILLPFALAGAIVNIIPMALVWLIARLKVADAVMATVKPLGALFVFLVTWSIWVWFGARTAGVDGAAVVLLLLPILLFALIAIFERGVLLARAIRGFARSRSIQDVYGQIRQHRDAVVDAVARAV